MMVMKGMMWCGRRGVRSEEIDDDAGEDGR